MKNFELFIGAFPGGDVYCNKAVIVRGDYKQIAFIDYTGKLSLSVDPSTVPHDVLVRIEHDADTKAANFRKNWDKLPELKRYEKLLDGSGLGGVLYIHYLPDDFTLADKIDFLEWVVYGWLPHSVKVADAIENYKNSKYFCKGVKKMINYTWRFYCIDNGGKRQFFNVKASDKTKAFDKAMKKARKNSAGDINNWECKLVLGVM